MSRIHSKIRPWENDEKEPASISEARLWLSEAKLAVHNIDNQFTANKANMEEEEFNRWKTPAVHAKHHMEVFIQRIKGWLEDYRSKNQPEIDRCRFVADAAVKILINSEGDVQDAVEEAAQLATLLEQRGYDFWNK